MLDVADLVTAYGKIEALKGVSLHVESGRITCLLGPNGAGKTTLMMSIAAILKPRRGSIRLDGDELVFNTGQDTVKGRNLARDGRVALCVDDERPPFGYAVLQGRAELSDALPQLREWATRIAARYVGADRAEEYGARNGVPGQLLVRVRIDKVLAVSGISE